MRKIEKTNSTYEAALADALQELGLTEDQVTIIDKKESGLIRKKVTITVEEKQTIPMTISEFINTIIAKMNLKCEATVTEEDDAYVVQLTGDDTGVLIGYRGDVLDSLQYLTLLIINKNSNIEKRLVIDGENYREKRQQTLARLAKKLAFQASKSGKEVKLEPMNPFERRVIHSALADDSYVTTTSEGVEPNRYVVIQPVKRSFNRDNNSNGYNRDRKPYNKDKSQQKPAQSTTSSTEPQERSSSFANFNKTGGGKMKSFGGEKKRLF